MDVSVIIVNWNTKELTSACIESVFKYSSGFNFEVILIDNGSTDESKNYFEKDSRIKYLYQSANLGFGRANNIGYSIAKGENILLLNSDTLLYDNVIYQLYNFLNNSSADIGCVGTVLRDRSLLPCHSYGRLPKWYNDFKIGCTHQNDYSSSYPIEVDMISAACVMIKRKVVEDFGLFDPAFFMYYEDTELMHRYKRSGVKSYVVNVPGVIHLEGASSNNDYRKTLVICRSFFLYLDKTLPRPFAILTKALISMKRAAIVWRKSWSLAEKCSYVRQHFSLIK